MPLAGSYLDVTEYKARTVAPASLVDGLHIQPERTQERTAWRTFVESRLIIETSKINAILAKRYAVPFATPVPEIVLGWLVARVTPKIYERRGWDPSDAQAQSILGDAATALEELKEAANSETGLYDLPLRQDLTASSGVERGGPLGYSEATPYAWLDVQREEVGS